MGCSDGKKPTYHSRGTWCERGWMQYALRVWLLSFLGLEQHNIPLNIYITAPRNSHRKQAAKYSTRAPNGNMSKEGNIAELANGATLRAPKAIPYGRPIWATLASVEHPHEH